MSDLINRSALIEQFKKVPAYFESGDIRYGIEIAVDIAEKQPSVEPVCGEWIHDINNLYGCSICGNRETMSPKKMKNFCPDCGADMRKGGGLND